MSNKKFKTVTWEAFQAMGDPDNVEVEHESSNENPDTTKMNVPIRVYLEKKGRKGKSVTVVKGLDAEKSYIETMAREMKKICGVGGTVTEGLIILQGDQRNKCVEHLKTMGYTDIKKAGG